MTIKWKRAIGFCLIIAGLVFCSVGLRNLFSPAQYRAEVKIKVNDISDSIHSLIESTNLPAYDPHFLQTQFGLMQSDLILGKVVEAPALKAKQHSSHRGTPLEAAEAIALIRKRLELRPVRSTKLVSVRFTSTDPIEAAAVANAIADAYDDYIREQGEELRIGHMKELQRQLMDAEQKVKAAQEKVRAFFLRDVDGQGTVATPEQFTNEMRRLEALVTEVDLKARAKEEQLTRLNSLAGEEHYQALMTSSDDSGLAELLAQRGEFEGVVTRLQQDTNALPAELFSASNRLVIVQQRVEERAKGILTAMSGDVTRDRTSANALRDSIRKAYQQREENTARALHYRDAKEELRQAQQEMNNTQSKFQIAEMDTRLRLDHTTTIKDRADVPRTPVGPNRYLGAALLTLGLVSAAIGLQLRRSANNAQ